MVLLPHLVRHLHTFVIIISSYAARGCIGVAPSGTLVATCGCGHVVAERLRIARILVVFLVEHLLFLEVQAALVLERAGLVEQGRPQIEHHVLVVVRHQDIIAVERPV